MAKTPHFFSLILDDPVQQMLIIPTSFLRVYGNHLSRKAFLKVPYGENWKVDLVKIGNNVWFGNGWKPFADFYSISYGSFLMFGFEDFQNSTFSVLIFDKSASEIDYPFHLQEEEEDNDDQEQPNVEEQVDSDSPSDTDVFPISSEDESQKPSTSRPHKGNKKKNRTQSEAKRSDNGELWNAERKANAVNRVTTFYKSNNPFFCIVIQSCYVYSRSATIPAIFAHKYFKKQRGFLSLKFADRKTWCVEYSSYRIHQKYRITMISKGWSKFVKDNQLAVGDVCVFEMINPNATKLKVVIFRENQIASMG